MKRTMRGAFPAVIVALALGLSACGDSKRTLETAASTPDAYTAYRQVALSTPPDFARRPSREDATKRAVESERTRVTQRSSSLPATWRSYSPGLRGFMSALQVQQADANIRDALTRETSVYAFESKEFADSVVLGDVPASAPRGTKDAIVITREKTGLIDRLF